MNWNLGEVILRRPEPEDVDKLYDYKNDPEVGRLLVGFSTGYSRADIGEWIKNRGQGKTEVVWVIAEAGSNRCLGHVGIYNITFRSRTGEMGILIGEKEMWDQGIGAKCTRFMMEYAFDQLNLNRLELRVLNINERAIHLYEKLGFRDEGARRQAKYQDGKYLDIKIMAILRGEFDAGR